jgi:hypothetical protein
MRPDGAAEARAAAEEKRRIRPQDWHLAVWSVFVMSLSIALGISLAYPFGIIFGTLVSMEHDEKVRVNRLRRVAARQGYQLHKKRRIDPRATDYGTYQLTPAKGKPKEFASIDEVEAFLTG